MLPLKPLEHKQHLKARYVSFAQAALYQAWDCILENSRFQSNPSPLDWVIIKSSLHCVLAAKSACAGSWNWCDTGN